MSTQLQVILLNGRLLIQKRIDQYFTTLKFNGTHLATQNINTYYTHLLNQK